MVDDGRVPQAEPGSREPSPDGLGPSGFDPSRVERFTSECGYEQDLPDNRKVALAYGANESGEPRWLLWFENGGEVTKVGLSPEAMFTLARLYHQITKEDIAGRLVDNFEWRIRTLASAIDAGTGETADAGSIAEGDESAAAKPDAQTPAPRTNSPDPKGRTR